MDKPIIARASATIDAPAAAVWEALVTPEIIKRYMFGATVVSDWKEGSPIRWMGEWKGQPFEDKGVIVRLEPGRMLRYTHFSPLAGQPDIPENYHTVTIELTPLGEGTLVSLAQDGNPTEEAREHSEKNWSEMLASLKEVMEFRTSAGHASA
jgi:uncharacterized protein YndB with AHSA1/START domain